MGVLLGHLNMADTDYPFTIVNGQEVMYAEAQKVFQRYNADFEAAQSLFVQGQTENFKERHKLPGSGYLEEEDAGGNAGPSSSAKAAGSYDVAYPLKQYGRAFSFDDVVLGYMSLMEFENHLQTIINMNNDLGFNLILKPLFNNVAQTFQDVQHGALTIQCGANQDGTLYPPVFGSIVDAQANNYLAPNYIESAISDANNPYKLIRDTLEPHYGFPQGGSPIIALVNTSAVSTSKLLTNFDEFTNRYLIPGANITTLTGLPEGFQGGRIVGVSDGVVIVEWPRIPTGWMLGMHMDAPKPLKRRVDPARTGIAPGLKMVSKDMEFPFHNNRWRNRLGYGVSERLNIVAVALNGTPSYTVPTLFQ